MSKTELTKMRRKDRSMPNEWIKEQMRNASYCSIATVDNDQPHINTNTFVYDEDNNALYFHTAKQGRLRSNCDKNNKVAVTVTDIGRFLPSEYAREFSVEYSSVVIFGVISIIENMKVARNAMQMLLDKYFSHLKPEKDYRPITPTEIKEIATYKIDIIDWSGKHKIEDENFKGAFYYPYSEKE